MICACKRLQVRLLILSSLLTAPAFAIEDTFGDTINAPIDQPNTKARTVQTQELSVPPRVRIGLKLTPYETVTIRDPKGDRLEEQKPLRPMQHVLRARLAHQNHFYVNNWHIESVPLRWVSSSKQYAVRLHLYKQHGANSELEEKMASIDVAGVLEGDERVFTLKGLTKSQIKDKFGNVVVDIEAGSISTDTPPVKEQLLGIKVDKPEAPKNSAPVTSKN